MLRIKSAAKVKEEEELLKKSVEMNKKTARKATTEEFVLARDRFKEAVVAARGYLILNCKELLAAHPELTQFRASHEEVNTLMDYLMEHEDDLLQKQLLRISQLDSAMEYEAAAICLEQPRAWKSCWPELFPDEVIN